MPSLMSTILNNCESANELMVNFKSELEERLECIVRDCQGIDDLVLELKTELGLRDTYISQLKEENKYLKDEAQHWRDAYNSTGITGEKYD